MRQILIEKTIFVNFLPSALLCQGVGGITGVLWQANFEVDAASVLVVLKQGLTVIITGPETQLKLWHLITQIRTLSGMNPWVSKMFHLL